MFSTVIERAGDEYKVGLAAKFDQSWTKDDVITHQSLVLAGPTTTIVVKNLKRKLGSTLGRIKHLRGPGPIQGCGGPHGPS